MAVPPFGATGLDKSDPATFVASTGFLAPSSMGASEGFRKAVSDEAVDRPRDDDDAPNATFDQVRALAMLRDASSQSKSFFESRVHASWQRNYRAVHNEHFEKSIYLSEAYKTRSKLFKPKTRAALMKRLAMTAKALFTPGRVVSVEPEDDTNPQQVASAELKQELLNYRLSTPTLRNGIPWFLTASGAAYDVNVTSLCVSKQFWNFKEVDTGEMETVPVEDPQTGERKLTRRPKMRVEVDKPDVMLIAPENVRFDPNANWTNVAQLSSYLLLQFSMTADEAWNMVSRSRDSATRTPWLDTVTFDTFKNKAGGATPSETTGPRSARAGGIDPTQQASGAFKPVWLTECFMRYGGRDYVFWALDDSVILSEPVPVEQVYPWCYGERPVVIGNGQLEPHKTFPMSAVESWQPLQQEINDQTNLRLDREKQVVSPPTKIKRGAKVDLQAVQRKGPNGLILVNEMTDVEPFELPDVPGSLFNESTLLSADFDDLSGNFNAASVQTNRQMNETVGGMHLLAESGNQIADFDMSLWVETWVQPVMLQLLKLEEYYESDAKVLAICGQRAKLWERYGINAITDEFLRAEATARVNVGIGAASLPMQRVRNMSMAWDVTAKALAPFIQTGKIEVDPNAEEIVNFIFSASDFRDGGARFFNYVGPPRQQQQPPPDPKAQAAMMQAQVKQQSNQIAQEKNQGTLMIQARKLQDDAVKTRSDLMNDAANRRAGIDVAHMKAMAEMERARAQDAAAGRMKAFDHVHDHNKALMSPFLQALAQHLAPPPAPSAGGDKAMGPHGDPSKPLMAPMPSPHSQPQPGMYATL